MSPWPPENIQITPRLKTMTGLTYGLEAEFLNWGTWKVHPVGASN